MRNLIWGRKKGVHKISKAFTLVEILVVIVIIGALSSALFPRIMKYMERTRDIRRQLDLRNLAVAIESYKNGHRNFPLVERINRELEDWGSLMGPVTNFMPELSEYIASIPKDPLKNTQISFKTNTFSNSVSTRFFWKSNYVYQMFKKGVADFWAMVLIAKMETPNEANFIDHPDAVKNCLGGLFYLWGWRKSPTGVLLSRNNIRPRYDISCLHLCTSVERTPKGQQDKFVIKKDWTVECTYSSEDQLYYILKLD